MNSQLHHVVADLRQAELMRAAERERLVRTAKRTESSSRGAGSVRRRLRIALPIFAPPTETSGEAPGTGVRLRRAKLIEVRSHNRADDPC